MVGIVVVSHSRMLARAAVALAGEMLHGGSVPIEIAAGLDETTFGTDAEQIVSAITAADAASADGVVVLMDSGSAVLSAELALELLDGEQRERVLLCAAPLVEGLVVASVSAAGGADREAVAAEASGALAGKAAQLEPARAAQPEPARPVEPEPPVPAGSAVTASFTLVNPHGLHARPAARLVSEVRGFDATVELRNRTTGSHWVSAASLSRLGTLGALQGHQVDVRARGNQAEEAVAQLLELAEGGFGEQGVSEEGPTVRPEVGPPARQGPVGASPGLGIGPAWSPGTGPIEVPDVPAGDPADEWRRLEQALDTVRSTVERIRAHTERKVGESDAGIFDTHLALLEDPELLAGVRARIERGHAAPAAWSASLSKAHDELAALPDPYLRARAADVAAVGEQVLHALLGTSPAGLPAEGSDSVLVAADLTPAEAAELDRSRVTAVVLAFGSPTAHSAILLRALGIPAVVAAGGWVLDIAEGTPLAVDGSLGELVVDPAPGVRQRYLDRAAASARRERRARARATAPSLTRDGVEILVGANLGSVRDAMLAHTDGADLAGLVRTEFLFLGREQAPDVDEQEATYRQIAAALGGKRITLRTLDVGGDKPLGYLPMPSEANPFLGVRGIRLSLARPALLTEQLLAMVRVAHDVPVSLMFPMVSTLDELLRARALLADAIKQVGRGEPAELQVGIMVEVPSTALKAAVFAPHVDFFSIGTNDLTQYTLAAERGNGAVAELGDPLDPGVLRLIDSVCRAAPSDTLVAVCGELAADEQATGVLLGLGVDELSVTPRAVPSIKQAVRGVHRGDAQRLAAAATAAAGADAVRALIAAGRP